MKPFPIEQLPCEICKVNLSNYLYHPIFYGSYAPIWYVICIDCITKHIVKIYDPWKGLLDCLGLPVRFTQVWDEENKEWVPATRKGKMFDV